MTGRELTEWWGRFGHLPPGLTEVERETFLLEIDAVRREGMPWMNMTEASLVHDQEVQARMRMLAEMKVG